MALTIYFVLLTVTIKKSQKILGFPDLAPVLATWEADFRRIMVESLTSGIKELSPFMYMYKKHIVCFSDHHSYARRKQLFLLILCYRKRNSFR
jgi:hypothetical protein